MNLISRATVAAGLILLATTPPTNAIEGLKLTVQCPDVRLGWPSLDGEAYIVQWRPTLDPSTPWVTLTNSLPADSSTNWTTFVHSNVVQCATASTNSISGDPSGPPPVPSIASRSTTSSQFSEPMAMPADASGSAVPLCLYPPGFDLSAYIIFDPATGEWLSGAGYVAANPAINSFQSFGPMDGPQPDDGPPPGDPGFYRVVRTGLHLVTLTNTQPLQGTCAFPIELGTDQPGNPQIRLKIEGDTAPASHLRPGPGYPVIEWDTHYAPNGSYSIYLECDFSGGEAVLYSQTNLVTLTNDITFDTTLSSFGEQMWIFARVASPPVSYEIALFDDQSNEYLGSFIDTNTDGYISFLWDLTDGGSYTFTNQSFRGEFYTSSLATNAPVKTATNRWNKDNGWSQDDFAIAWANTAKVLAPTRMHDLMRYGVVDILGTPIGGYTLSPGNNFGTGNSFNLTTATKTNLLTYLNDPTYRNFYFFGHGNAGGIGDSSNWAVNPPWITEGELRAAMTNYLAQTGQPAVTAHPYRFVFLDSCNSANGNLCEAFGIHRVPANLWSTWYYVNVVKMKPRVFIGYTAAVDLPSTYDEHIMNANMLGQLLGEWRDGAAINGCLLRAKANTQWPMSPSAITYGAWDLRRSSP